MYNYWGGENILPPPTFHIGGGGAPPLLAPPLSTPLPVHSETEIPNDLCAERREFPLKASNKRVNVCTYQDRIRVDVREFINDRATIKGLYFTSREFISFNGALPFVRHEVLRQMEILQNASNST